jgi:hypothetical protein
MSDSNVAAKAAVVKAQSARVIDDDEYLAKAKLIVDADKIKKADAKKAAKAAKEAAIVAAKKSAIVKAAADRAEARAAGKDPAPEKDYEFKLDDPPEIQWAETKNNGDPIKGYANALVCVRALDLTCRHDTFLDKYTVVGTRLGDFSGELNDATTRKFRERCVDAFGGFEPGKDASFDALQHVCEQNRFDSLRQQLDVLKWDGTPRVYQWLTTYLGVEDSPLHRAQGELVLMAAIRRVYDPGCVFQHVLVLEGPEGTDKSSVVKVLACGQAEQRPLYFSDSPILHLREREQQELTKGVWFYELGELAMMNRADQFNIKRFITAEEERARAAYAHFKSNQARIAIFVGTFNTDENNDGLVEYLNPGDRRRWWGVRIGVVHPIDLAGLRRDRWQLFAEAKAMHSDGLGSLVWRSLRLSRDLWAAATVEQIEREKVDPFVEILAPLYSSAVRWYKAHPKGTRDGFKVVPDVEVRVATRKVLELLPDNASTLEGGRRVPKAMSKTGWTHMKLGGVSWYRHPWDDSENDDGMGGDVRAADMPVADDAPTTAAEDFAEEYEE